MDHVRRPAADESGLLQGRARAIRRRSCSRSSDAGRQLAMYDPKTKKLTHISTCFGTHHLMFAEDANNTLWTSGGGQVVGWLNTKMFDETRRRGEVAGLDRAHPRHQRQRQARRLRRAEPAGRSGEGQALRRRRSTRSRRRPTDRSGDRCSASRARSSGSCPARIRRRPRWPKSTSRRSTIPKRPSQGSRRAAWTSIATASSGRRSRAATWPASIGASARGR